MASFEVSRPPGHNIPYDNNYTHSNDIISSDFSFAKGSEIISLSCKKFRIPIEAWEEGDCTEEEAICKFILKTQNSKKANS